MEQELAKVTRNQLLGGVGPSNRTQSQQDPEQIALLVNRSQKSDVYKNVIFFSLLAVASKLDTVNTPLGNNWINAQRCT